MGNESGEWIMFGLPDDDPECIHTFDELSEFIEKVGFLPLFRNSIEGFSVEEYTNPAWWWSESEERDPWFWRKLAARSQNLAYGKFFGGKAGIISREWLPVFMSYRRNGYDFESLWFDGRAQFRQKKIMDCLADIPEMSGYQLKRAAGFGKNGEKNFDGTITALQDMLYVVISDFRPKKNKYGLDYGWDVSIYSLPEKIWGSELTREVYNLSPSRSYAEIRYLMSDLYTFTDAQFRSLIGKEPA